MSILQAFEKPKSAGAAYVLIFSGGVAALQIGKLPPALPEISQALGMTLTQSGFLLSFIQLAGMSLALAIGMSADTWGAKRSMLWGLTLLGLASAMGSMASSVAGLMFWRIIEGLGFLCVVLPAPGLIRQQVQAAQLRKLLGYWGAYMPAGTALTLLLGPLWLPEWGWRSWWCLFAVLSWGMALVLWRVVPVDSSATVVAVHWQQRLRETLSAPVPWWVTLCFGMYSGQWLAVVGFLPSIYTQAGLSGGTLGALTAFAAAVNMLGNVMSGRLLQRGLHPSLLLVIGFMAMALGAFLAFSEFTNAMPWLRYAGVLLFSSCGGLVPGTLFFFGGTFGASREECVHHGGLDAAGLSSGSICGATFGRLAGHLGGGLAMDMAGDFFVLCSRMCFGHVDCTHSEKTIRGSMMSLCVT